MNSVRQVLLIIILNLIFCLSGAGGISRADELAAGQNNSLIQQHQHKISTLTAEINQHKTKIDNSEEQEYSLRQQLDHLQNQISLAHLHHHQLQQQITAHQQQIKNREEKLKQLQEVNLTLKKQAEKRLRAYYQMGDIGFFNVIFSADSLPQLLAFNQYFQCLLQNDRQVLSEYQVNIKNLNHGRSEMEMELARLDSAFNAVGEQEKFLDKANQEKQKLLKKIKTEKTLSLLAVKEMTAVKNKLRATLHDLQQQGPEPSSTTTAPNHNTAADFASQKSILPPPVDGHLTNTFAHHDNLMPPTPASHGISIRSAPGSPVIAVHPGKILYADYLQNYGKLIIIDHGDNYLTLTGGIGRILTESGATVNAGEIIGRSSLHQGRLNKEIIFQIRHHRRPQNPINWVDQTKLIK